MRELLVDMRMRNAEHLDEIRSLRTTSDMSFAAGTTERSRGIAGSHGRRPHRRYLRCSDTGQVTRGNQGRNAEGWQRTGHHRIEVDRSLSYMQCTYVLHIANAEDI